MSEKKQCSERVSGEGRWGAFHPHSCQRPAKVERDGKLYCGTHDPVAKKIRPNWSEPNMRLPEGKTCSDCVRFRGCTNFLGNIADNRVCDWAPSYFVSRENPDVKS